MRRLLPILAGAQALGILLADRGLLRPDAALVSGATAIALGAGVARGRSARRALAVVAAAAAGALAIGGRLDAAARSRPPQPVELTVEGTVRAATCSGSQLRVELTRVAAVEPDAPRPPERVRLLDRCSPVGTTALESALPGERIRARVWLRAPHALRNPGSRHRVRSLEREGIGGMARLVHPALHVRLPEREGWRPLAGLHRHRARIGERLSAAGPGGALLRALALGDRRGLLPETRDAFARLGLSHLLAVSGLHLTLVASLLFAAVRLSAGRSAWLAARRDTRVIALAAGVAGAASYALLAGWGIPVRRALILLLAVALSVARGRPGVRGQPLSAAAIAVLAVEPHALFRAGAQLSFAASAALAMAVQPPPVGADHRSTRVRQSVSDGLRASATALAATAPLAALHLGSVAPLALATNLVAIPWTALVLLPAALAAAIAASLPVTSLGELVLAGTEWLAAAALWAAQGAAPRLPGATSAPPPGPLALGAAGLLLLLVLRARRARTRAALALLGSAILALAPPGKIPPPPPRVVAMEVGQGDATLVQGGAASVLIDGGRAIPGGVDLGRRAVVPALRALGVRKLDLLLVTHADLDHRGGVPAVLEALPVREMWVPFGIREAPAFALAMAAARARAVPVRERGAGSPPARLEGLVVTALWPPAAGGESPNDRSLVVRIDVEGRRVLLPGDVEAASEAALLASGVDLRADVLKLPHHGARTSSSAAFLDAVGASVAVASAPCAGRFGMPHPEVLRRARSAGLPVWWTGRDGAVLIGLGERVVVWGMGEPPARRGPSCRRGS